MSPCRNEKDIEFCIQTILGAFNGERTASAKKKIDKPVIGSTEEVKKHEEQNNLDLE
ncbi:AGAP012420-PA-like protein [Anopheles sinensis]|uniref:AGAP012420-PA-like protein n=1 Tax=Anopheles sinensis TaxID=74873 RepID=A0A084WIC1_ANOSI|nr:AGAP012420-PA-like protein [Anopheles sinensis]